MAQARLHKDKRLILEAIIDIKHQVKAAQHNEKLRLALYKGLNYLKEELVALIQQELGAEAEPNLFSDQKVGNA